MGDQLGVDEYVDQITAGSRVHIARAITLVESRRADHQELADELLEALAPLSGNSMRVGISGVPGVGKSTFVEGLGMNLVGKGHHVAVLAVDPSSTRTGGSILGDRTRMAQLSVNPNAFVRPSPTAGVLGGVARATREAIMIMEAAGFDVILVETVGVGQSEVAVASMVDCFLLLALARTGDQLQGIKRGILELADVIAVNKAEGPHVIEAQKAARELAGALRMAQHPNADWTVPVLTCSGLTGEGVDEVWAAIEAHREVLVATGAFQTKRAQQRVTAAWAIVADRLIGQLRVDPNVKSQAEALESRLREGTMSPSRAATTLLKAYRDR
jgi:LAO/AO transport system kinase